MQRDVARNALSLQLGAVAAVLNTFALGRIGALNAAAVGAVVVHGIAAVAGRRGERSARPTRDPRVLGAGLLDGAGTVALFLALERLGPVPVALLSALSPALAAVAGVVLLRERPGARALGLGALAVAGGVLFAWRGDVAASAAGVGLAMLASAAFTASNALAAAALRVHRPFAVLGGAKLASLVPIALLGLVGGALGPGLADGPGLLLAIGGALLGSLLAVVLFYAALREGGLARTGLARAAAPLATAACAWPFFPVSLGAPNVVGAAVLVAAIAGLARGASDARA